MKEWSRQTIDTGKKETYTNFGMYIPKKFLKLGGKKYGEKNQIRRYLYSCYYAV